MEPGVLCAGAEAGSRSSWHSQECVSLVSWPCPSGPLPRISAAPQLPARCQEGWSSVSPCLLRSPDPAAPRPQRDPSYSDLK